MDIKVNDQVMFKKPMKNGTLVRMGSVVRVDGENSLVHFPIDHSQAVIPNDKLQKTSTKFGQYVRVQVDPIRRSM